MIAVRRRRDAGPDADALRALTERGEPAEGEGRVTPCVAPGVEVVADGDAVEAQLLGEHGVVEELARRELLGGGLVSEGEHGPPC